MNFHFHEKPTHPIIDSLISQIKEMTEQYKNEAILARKQITNCENLRTRILNTIEEAEYEGLNIYTASRLKEKLKRPYSFSLLN